MKFIAWVSALLIFSSLYASVSLERIAKSGHPERAKVLLREVTDAATYKILKAADNTL